MPCAASQLQAVMSRAAVGLQGPEQIGCARQDHGAVCVEGREATDLMSAKLAFIAWGSRPSSVTVRKVLK